MKNSRIHCICTSIVAAALALLPGCANDGSLSPQGRAELSALADVAIGVAAAHYGISPSETQAVTLAANSLFGVAAQAQANLGQTPVAANIAQGASTPAIGAAIQSALPNTPMTQSTVNILDSAAATANRGTHP